MSLLEKLNHNLSDIAHITELLIESDGEITEELEKYLSSIELSTAKTVDKMSTLLSRLEMEQEYFKSLSDQYYKAARSIENFHDRLRTEIKSQMISSNLSTLEGQNVKFKLSPAQPKLVIESDVGPKYKTQVVTTEIDKEKIKEDLKEGLFVPGARLEQSFSLRSYLNVKRR